MTPQLGLAVIIPGIGIVSSGRRVLELILPFKVAKGIVKFRMLSLCSISNESISSLNFSFGHDLRNAL